MPPNQKGRTGNDSRAPEYEQPARLLQELGYDEWFHHRDQSRLTGDFSPARVVAVNKNHYQVSDGCEEIHAELAGRFLFNIEQSVDYPTVGDWVAVQYFDQNSLAIIHNLLPRRSVLKRKDPGKEVDFQLIAANIDYALIMQSADANFNLNRLERYLVMANESRIQPVIVLSKTDLLSEAARTEILDQLEPFIDKYKVFPVSTVTGEGIGLLEQELQAGKTYCLLGSSGVGKTTLLNTLVGESLLAVNEVRKKDSKGRHITVRRELICLKSGSIFIDTPGMRELGNFAIDDGLQETFDKIFSYGHRCRYKDCSHTHEPNCAVRDAVERGDIDEERYRNYLKLRKEAAHYETSYAEKRRKEKMFGKMMKNYKKSMRKR